MEQYTYLTLITVWALPVIVMQWLVGIDVMIKRWKVWIPGIIIPTIWLTALDSLPLASGTWTINPESSTGILIPLINVPIEEGIFFLVTNTLVIQGFICTMYFGLLWGRIKRLFLLLRRGPGMLNEQPKNESVTTSA
jgi:lycopene beta-cyclase